LSIEKLLIIIIEQAIPKIEMKEIPVMQKYSPYQP